MTALKGNSEGAHFLNSVRLLVAEAIWIVMPNCSFFFAQVGIYVVEDCNASDSNEKWLP